MGKRTTTKVPRIDRDGYRVEDGEVTGQVCIIDVDGHKIRFLIHDDTLTHIASGRRVGNLNGIKALHHRSYFRLTDRAAAVELVRNLVARHGLAKVRDNFLNPPAPPAIGDRVRRRS